MILSLEIVLVALVLGGGGAFIAIWRRECRRPRIVCLMYHRIVSSEDYRLTKGTERVFSLPAEEFEKQVSYLKKNGYQFVTPAEVIEMTEGRWHSRQQGVLITFDDGCVSVHDVARPILQRHGATGVSFVTTDPDSYVFRLNGLTDRRMTEPEIQACQNAGISIQSHAVSHRPLRGLDDDEALRELADSKRELERIVGGQVEGFAVPGNWWDARIMRIAREAGYRAVWVSNPGSVRPGNHLFGLPRVNVEGNISLAQFAAAISPLGIAMRIAATQLKWLPSRLLGPRLWLPIRRVLLHIIPGGHVSTRRVVIAGSWFVAVGACAIVFWLLTL